MLAMVVPCYNEEMRFNIPKWQEVISKLQNCHWIFVNDGSTDKTIGSLNQLTKNNVHLVDLPKNTGKGEAIRAGFIFALVLSQNHSISRIGYLDSDFAFDLEDIRTVFLESESKLGEGAKYRTIIGSRVKLAGRKIQRSNLRHYLGRAIATFICRGWALAPYDTQSGFKIFTFDSYFIEAMSRSFVTSWFFDIEILLRLEKMNSLGIWEIPLTEWSEIEGSSIKPIDFFLILRQILQARFLVKQHCKDLEHTSGLA